MADFNGTDREIEAAWPRLIRESQTAGRGWTGDPPFEYYPVSAQYEAKTGEFECEICVPVTPPWGL